jgi:2-methylcitrate dehydratase
VTLYVDAEMEQLGYDQVRSKIRVRLKNGKTLAGRADVARGHPRKPMTWAELSEKFYGCAALVLPHAKAEAIIEFVSRLPEQRSLAPLLRALVPGDEKRTRKNHRGKSGSRQWSRTRRR